MRGGVRARVRGTWRAIAEDRPSSSAALLGHERSVQVLRLVTGAWGTAIGLMATSVAVILARHRVDGVDAGGALVVGVGALLVGVGFLLAGNRIGERGLVAVSLGALIMMVIEVRLLGPAFEMAMVVPALACIQALFYLPRRMTIIGGVLVAGSYAALVLGTDGYPAPAVRLTIFVTVLVATSVVLAWIVGEIERLSLRERSARAELADATAALAEANARLEEQVGQQGEQIGSLQQLRQFVSPAVAHALLDEGIDALAPHRGRIAVLFCDLRGFTAFSSSAEPEEVMEVLETYYATVGQALQEAGATVGSFAGDGIMAYFGDPVPCDDPAGAAVEMAVGLNQQMRHAVLRWRRRGYDVGCGFGIAYGFATIGPVGFDGRADYTALGPTVNLASRLCDLAADGELLIDGRTFVAVEGRVASEERTVEVRGFRSALTAHLVTAWAGETAP